MSKEQKTQMELQSVDGANGQAAQTSKMMTWMMPIMFGIFSFMCTASFSLYLIISTLFSTASTFIINKLVERNFQKQMQKEEEMKYEKRFGYLKKDKKD
jgi:membrane protein insertase Oxa1/YidC/SpoIIIJ